MIIKAITILQSFRRDEDGLALTEYLILLGLLVGASIAAISLIGEDLGLAWDAWVTFFDTAELGYVAPTE
jgi:pilus assembly protein Flp/PilA